MLVDQNVLRLYIPMNDSLSMEVTNCHEELFHIDNNTFFRKPVPFRVGKCLKHVLALDIFHYKVQMLRTVVSFEVFDYVWVVNPIQNLYFFDNKLQSISELPFL